MIDTLYKSYMAHIRPLGVYCAAVFYLDLYRRCPRDGIPGQPPGRNVYAKATAQGICEIAPAACGRFLDGARKSRARPGCREGGGLGCAFFTLMALCSLRFGGRHAEPLQLPRTSMRGTCFAQQDKAGRLTSRASRHRAYLGKTIDRSPLWSIGRGRSRARRPIRAIRYTPA